MSCCYSFLFLLLVFAELSFAEEKNLIPKRYLLKNLVKEDTKHGFNTKAYNSYHDIAKYLRNLPKRYDNVAVETVNKTFEGRDIILVTIKGKTDVSENVIMVDSGTHAREWASIASCLHLLDAILEGGPSFSRVSWKIIPVVNPDGYEYSRTTDRNWRKNRSKQSGSECIGVDLNRNYAYHWGEKSVSTDPCNYFQYGGPSSLSEAETQAVSSVMLKNKKSIKLYVSMHSYGGYILYPWGYKKNTYSPRSSALKNFGNQMASAIRKKTGHKYLVMVAGDMYAASGASDDYAHGVFHIPYTYTLELTNGFRFEYPENLLPTLFMEVEAAFQKAAALIDKKFRVKNKLIQKCPNFK